MRETTVQGRAGAEERPTEAIDSRPVYRVAAFGLGAASRHVTEVVFRHAHRNPYRFTVVSSRAPDDFDLALVNMTSQGAEGIAQTLRGLPRSRAIVTVGRREDPSRACDDLLLRRYAECLIGVLNQVVEGRLMRPAAAQRAPVSGRGPNALEALAERHLGRRAKVLVIDPSPALRRSLALTLGSMGLDAHGVGGGREALEVLERNPCEGVLLEADLPDMSGLSLVRSLSRDPRWRDMARIMLTHRVAPWDKLAGALSGCDSYLVKPVSNPVLCETVSRCLQRVLGSVSQPPAALKAATAPGWRQTWGLSVAPDRQGG